MIHATPADIVRFMSYVDKLPNGCWFWTGARSRGKGNKKWYGSFHVGKRTVRAHRFACEVLAHKPLDEERGHRGHTCHFSLCVNPGHLEIITREENQEQINGRNGERYDLRGLSKLVRETAANHPCYGQVASIVLNCADHIDAIAGFHECITRAIKL